MRIKARIGQDPFGLEKLKQHAPLMRETFTVCSQITPALSLLKNNESSQPQVRSRVSAKDVSLCTS
jgi:hypothetical protein